MLGYFDTDNYSDVFWDKAEGLPGGFIIQREIKKAVSGSNFFYNDSDTGKPVRCEAVSGIEFRYYFDIWDNYHYFGLPHGSGWGSERQWLLNFLKRMEKTFTHVDNFKIEKKQRKAEARAQNG